ncbi:beta-N-acetylhexosaminidase [Melghirimyces algeriensis]|uniref:beta-N-acetylhexosaminidase n=1 Tax=Melghirimyces algeriensis TaxID=910412 RepID=A0A521CKI5_9BACL|nr:beta-N-acetylhexosaminidase [Melghirimyces algeriensis]SMO59948.1 beta-N-acetylhexosaminidase [Melghirimyces algeriensis]
MAPVLRGFMILTLVLMVMMFPSSVKFSSVDLQDKAEIEQAIDEKIEKMTLKEKVGQMFIVGFHNGGQPAFQMNRQIRTLIRDEKVGGVILFDRNIQSPSQVGKLTNKMQQLALSVSPQIPLFVSVDQEGGKVTRIREGVTVFPGGMALGASDNTDLSYRSGFVTGSELRAMGINMNMAPVLDVNNNPRNPVIGVRSFSSDPHLVSKMASAQIRGYHDGQVLTVAKHFPGHGDTSSDSHVNLPTVNHPMERLKQMELVPFKHVLNETDAIMSAHITFPAIEDTPGLPGTLSKKVLTGLLRERLGYQGLIITDDLEMGAIVENFGAKEAAVQAVKAGADVLLISHDLTRQQSSIHAVRRAVESGEISEKRIDQSVRRILQLKGKKTGKTSIVNQPLAAVEKIPEQVATEKNRTVAGEVAQAGITLVQDPQSRIPIKQGDIKRMLVVSPVRARELGKSLSSDGFSVQVQSVEPDPQLSTIRKITDQATNVDVAIVATSRAEANPGQVRLIRALEDQGVPVIALGLDTPYEVASLSRQTTYLALYSSTRTALEAATEAITGKKGIKGKLPIDIPGLYPKGYGLKR